jgi:hypothetical protein
MVFYIKKIYIYHTNIRHLPSKLCNIIDKNNNTKGFQYEKLYILNKIDQVPEKDLLRKEICNAILNSEYASKSFEEKIDFLKNSISLNEKDINYLDTIIKNLKNNIDYYISSKINIISALEEISDQLIEKQNSNIQNTSSKTSKKRTADEADFDDYSNQNNDKKTLKISNSLFGSKNPNEESVIIEIISSDESNQDTYPHKKFRLSSTSSKMIQQLC